MDQNATFLEFCVKFFNSPNEIKEIPNYDLVKLIALYSQGTNRGLHHDLHGMGEGPFSFGEDEALYKLVQDEEVYGVLRAWIFLTDHDNSSGTIQFLQKKNGNEYYLGKKSYSDTRNIADVETYLVNPNIERNSILLFNKSTIHSARALRRISCSEMSNNENGLHPINELKSINNQNGTCPYPSSRNFLTWDYVKLSDHGERLITNTVFMYTFLPVSSFWLNGKQNPASLLGMLSKRIYDIAPILVTYDLYQHQRIRLDLVICASVLYASICKVINAKGSKYSYKK